MEGQEEAPLTLEGLNERVRKLEGKVSSLGMNISRRLSEHDGVIERMLDKLKMPRQDVAFLPGPRPTEKVLAALTDNLPNYRPWDELPLRVLAQVVEAVSVVKGNPPFEDVLNGHFGDRSYYDVFVAAKELLLDLDDPAFELPDEVCAMLLAMMERPE